MCRGVAGRSYHSIRYLHQYFLYAPVKIYVEKELIMSYQVLARKWRPSNFKEMAGQSHVLKSLINALDNQRLHHAYLFTGTRGVGKTTLARILARCLNCDKGVSSEPCGNCDSCVAINEGRFLDLIEVDAASRTKVEDTRELLENVQYTPASGRYKVYLIDEVHMLSNHSFNALLKTLEEPPPHVKFLFATTDPQKLPVTVLSRCLQFNLKNLSPAIIVDYLQNVLQQESIDFEEPALWQIANAASGSMRDALTLSDQAISYCEGRIALEGVVEMLGIPDRTQVFEIVSAMTGRDVAKILSVVSKVAEQNADFPQILDSMLSFFHRIALAQVLEEAVDNSHGDRHQVLELRSKFAAEDIQLYYQMGLQGREELSNIAEPQSAFEMLLLRMILFSPNYSDRSLEQSSAPQSIGDQSTELASNGATEAASQEPPVAPTAASEEVKKKDLIPPLQSTSTNQSPAGESERCNKDHKDNPLPETSLEPATSDEQESTKLAADATENHSPSVSEPKSLSHNQQPSNDSEGLALQDSHSRAPRENCTPPEANAVQASPPKSRSDKPWLLLTHRDWLQIVDKLDTNGLTANLFANTVFQSCDERGISLQLDRGQSALFNTEHSRKMEAVICAYYQQTLTLDITVADVSQETAFSMGQRLKRERHQKMIEDFENDTQVKQLLDYFSATLAKDSIQALALPDKPDRVVPTQKTEREGL